MANKIEQNIQERTKYLQRYMSMAKRIEQNKQEPTKYLHNIRILFTLNTRLTVLIH